MLSLSQIEQDLIAAMKAKDQLSVEVLRGLKTRIQNEQIAKGKDLAESDIVSLIRSETKRRMEAAAAYGDGGRVELRDKELAEAEILKKYLPAQMSDVQLSETVDKFLAVNQFTAKDFGSAMGKLKAQVGDQADGASVARVLKEKLK